ncbi:histone H3 [Histoplasma ohiense]|nr:histone H3 [Histoplasma ohiense (nom. inval.)]
MGGSITFSVPLSMLFKLQLRPCWSHFLSDGQTNQLINKNRRKTNPQALLFAAMLNANGTRKREREASEPMELSRI